jgi:hypothetical protein
MSRNKNKIIKTLAKYNLTAITLDWQPIGIAYEMCGPCGGWLVETNEGDTYMAYNINELINYIETDNGHYTNPKDIQKYCNHVWWYKDGYAHSKGLTCVKCKLEKEEDEL